VSSTRWGAGDERTSHSGSASAFHGSGVLAGFCRFCTSHREKPVRPSDVHRFTSGNGGYADYTVADGEVLLPVAGGSGRRAAGASSLRRTHRLPGRSGSLKTPSAIGFIRIRRRGRTIVIQVGAVPGPSRGARSRGDGDGRPRKAFAPRAFGAEWAGGSKHGAPRGELDMRQSSLLQRVSWFRRRSGHVSKGGIVGLCRDSHERHPVVSVLEPSGARRVGCAPSRNLTRDGTRASFYLPLAARIHPESRRARREVLSRSRRTPDAPRTDLRHGSLHTGAAVVSRRFEGPRPLRAERRHGSALPSASRRAHRDGVPAARTRRSARRQPASFNCVAESFGGGVRQGAGPWRPLALHDFHPRAGWRTPAATRRAPRWTRSSGRDLRTELRGAPRRVHRQHGAHVRTRRGSWFPASRRGRRERR